MTAGNGVFDAPTGNWGECFLKLDGETLQVKDYFCPFNHDGLDRGDADLGASACCSFRTTAGSPRTVT